MKINSINTAYNTPTFKQNNSIVPYPEVSYRRSRINVVETDPFDSGIKSIAAKFEKAYRLLFSPEIDNSSKEIKESINFIFDGDKSSKGEKLSVVA